MGSVGDSQKDLISVTVSDSPSSGTINNNNNNMEPVFKVKSGNERRLVGALVVALLACAGLVIALVVVTSQDGGQTGMADTLSDANTCMTEGCIGTAHMILQNMNGSVDPCDDFYKFACGGFDERVVIPDDRNQRSQFSVIGDDLLIQLRHILEEDPKEGESRVFTMARNVYKACMDLDKIEEVGLDPLKQMLKEMGGWPVLEGDAWKADSFSWIDTVYTFRAHGYSTDYLIDFSIVTDSKNSSWRVIDIDQARLGLSREYLINGIDDHDVASYYNYMVNVAVLLGAERSVAEKELKESLQFEIKLAEASQARENRRNATRLYNPYMVKGDIQMCVITSCKL